MIMNAAEGIYTICNSAPSSITLQQAVTRLASRPKFPVRSIKAKLSHIAQARARNDNKMPTQTGCNCKRLLRTFATKQEVHLPAHSV